MNDLTVDNVSNANNKMNNPITHPAHYTTHPSGVECVAISEQMDFCLGNAFKYLFRCGHKGDAVEDLRKAAWYLERARQQREKLWFKWEGGEYDARLDGPDEMMWILEAERRYCGHMAAALSNVYAASVAKRGVSALDAAVVSVGRMIRLAECRK